MRRSIVGSVALALCTLGSLVACKKTNDGPMALCASEVEGGEATETQSNDVPPDIWFALILKSYNAKTHEPARPARDCTNRPLVVEDEAPPDGRATLFYVLRDGRNGVDWWWISVEVPLPPAA